MKIYSMNATFGKLSHQTLTLQPGLNIIEAPNEWGKSTWCAFMIAMLYGINTREQTKTGFLADKEHYAPWSGEPMSGRMELNWEGRDITIERRNKGRGFFNDFKAYETQTGLPVAELTATNCGQTLLGVEQSVFTRAGFLRQNELPVTEDEKLRSRLNALVTTGDESGASDELAQKLKDVKNRCRFNRSGLLPQAECQRDELQQKLSKLQDLQEQQEKILSRQEALKHYQKELENHSAALIYRENEGNIQKLNEARFNLEKARRRLELCQGETKELPALETVQQQEETLRQLRGRRDDLHQQARLMPQPPAQPVVAEPFRGIDPETAIEQAKVSARVYTEDKSKKYTLANVFTIVLAVIGAALLIVDHFAAKMAGIALLLGAILLARATYVDKKRRERTIHDLCSSYRPIPPEQWESAACKYAEDQAAYRLELGAYQKKLEQLETEMAQVNEKIAAITADAPVSEWEGRLIRIRNQWKDLEEASRQAQQAQTLVELLEGTVQEVSLPEQPDTLMLSMEQTRQQLSHNAYEQEQLQKTLGQNQGQMDALGNGELLEEQLEKLRIRIDKLEKIYEAVTYAMQMQQTATQELQRRFAPRISQRAQQLLGRLTGGRYDRLLLDQQLQLSSAAQGEDTLRSNLWRSSGTADQLYLALRLAVAQELTPQAPLVLDDALVRFDDVRMASALEILREEAENKQIILFTCQSRESVWLQENKEELQ